MNPEYQELQQKAINLATSEGLSEDKFQMRYTQLIKEDVEAIYENNKDVMMLAEKMKKGSIVLTNHIKTLDKARIITPTKSTQPLYDVKINPHDLIAIQSKIIHSIFPPEVDKLIKQNLYYRYRLGLVPKNILIIATLWQNNNRLLGFPKSLLYFVL